MKQVLNWKALMLSIVFMICLMPTMSAQKWDGYFSDDDPYENRDGDLGFNIGTQPFGSDAMGGIVITTQVFGQDTPLDGGLLIMLGAGAFYMAMKRTRRNRH